MIERILAAIRALDEARVHGPYRATLTAADFRELTREVDAGRGGVIPFLPASRPEPGMLGSYMGVDFYLGQVSTLKGDPVLGHISEVRI